MIQYRVFFLNDTSIVLTELEMKNLVQLPVEQGKNILRFSSPQRQGGINLANVTYYMSEEAPDMPVNPESGVVTPPTPSQIRYDKQQQQTNTPTTLDDQLDNVGK